MQMETTPRYDFIPRRVAGIKKTITDAERIGETEPSGTAGRNGKRCRHGGRCLDHIESTHDQQQLL